MIDFADILFVFKKYLYYEWNASVWISSLGNIVLKLEITSCMSNLSSNNVMYEQLIIK